MRTSTLALSTITLVTDLLALACSDSSSSSSGSMKSDPGQIP